MLKDIKNQEKRQSLEQDIPPVIFGTSGLGNLFVAQSEDEKLNIIRECFGHSKGKVVFDSAGKYGAGLALEALGNCLKRLNVPQEDVIISNKLGWVRTELKTPEPTFEPGVWRDIKHDAVQKISYNGIIECFEQGNELLNGYIPQMVSVHDPDEYLARARDEQHAKELYNDILEAYRALRALKQQGKVQSIGVGAKDWKIIQRIAGDVELDWVMIANSLTIMNHPPDLLNFVDELHKKGVFIINSAVFHAGFLVGGDYYNYRLLDKNKKADQLLYEWRDKFYKLCNEFQVKPAQACVQFVFKIPGVKSIALSTTNKNRVKENIDMVYVQIPQEFWTAMKERNLLETDFRYV
ncbi:MAG TPA: aldo/keto reductase [Chitinophagaceae bacterium]